MRHFKLLLLVSTLSLIIKPAFALPKLYDNLYGKAIAREMDNVMEVKAEVPQISKAIERYMQDPKYWNANSNCKANEKNSMSETWQCLPAVGTELLEIRFTFGYDKPNRTRLINELTIVDPGVTQSTKVQRYTKFDPKRYSSRFKTSLALQGAMLLRIKMWAEH